MPSPTTTSKPQAPTTTIRTRNNSPSTSTSTTTTAAATDPIYICLSVVGGVFILSLLSNIIGRNNKRTYSTDTIDLAKHLIKHSSRWGAVAAQDQNPLFAVVHSDYANAYMQVAMHIMPQAELERVCDIDVSKLEASISDEHEVAIQRLTTYCPAIAPEGGAAIASGWLG